VSSISAHELTEAKSMTSFPVKTFTRMVPMLLLMALIIFAGRPASAQGSIQGKLWVVSVADASNVRFPPPSATPDATFTTNGITYIGQDAKNHGAHCYTVGRFLGGCPTAEYNLRFSGLTNPILGGVVDVNTPMSGANYGIIIEFTGSIFFTHKQLIQILHDDGVSLMIDGTQIAGFGSVVTPPILESVRFTGITGTHSVDLLYANAIGGGAWLLFFPLLF
jgi:hypothetical protein